MRDDWHHALEGLAPELCRAMTFLREHLPESDLDDYPAALFLQFARHALSLRKEAPWCAALEQELFDHYVLFPRVNDEDLSFHRALFHDALWPRIQGLPTSEARVLAVNRWCHEIASYQSQDERTASPLTVYRCGSGRCGEESAFLVSALRSVGIPARQVYVPRWSHCDDNHAWVEALCDGQWRFLGACEPEPVLDRGWFNAAASQAVLVHSRLFGEGHSPLHGELVCREGGVSWYNQTPRYARVRIRTFRATWDGAPAPGTVFHLQLLNEAGFHTIASLTADSQGEAKATLGLGDIHVLAALSGRMAEGDCADGEITLALQPPQEEDTAWTAFDVHPPEAVPVRPTGLAAHQRAARAAVLQAGNALRKSRLASFDRRAEHGAQDLLQAARGNAEAVAAFLTRDGDPRREALLRTLTDKDLRDVSEQVLEDHLQNAPEQGSVSDGLYLTYVLCPRVELERLTAWRGVLRTAVTPLEQAAWRADPAALWNDLRRRMCLSPERTYANLVWTPAQAWQARRCDLRSLRILYVALLRTLGVPARLRLTDGLPEFWQDGAFRCVQREPMGTLRLIWQGSVPPVYRQNWTLSRRTDTAWQRLTLPDKAWQDGAQTLELPAGRYRLITSVRLPNGQQFALRRELTLRAGESKVTGLPLRPYALEDMLYLRELPVMPALSPDGRAVPDLVRSIGRPTLILWLEEGAEPTEHVLTELHAGQEELKALPVEVAVLLRARESLHHPALRRLMAGWPGLRVLLDDWAYDLESVARLLNCDPDTPPLCVMCDGEGRAVYGISGYHVGSVALLTRIAAHLCKTTHSS